jgi:hypothetical protein
MTTDKKAVVLADDRWNQFLSSLASGLPLADALLKHGLSTRDVTTTTFQPAAAKQFFEAQAAARRRNWAIWDFEAVCVKVASGMSVKTAVIEVKGEDLRAELYELLDADEALAARFELAEHAAARITDEELLEIADNKEGDVLMTPKGPIPSSANVGRSTLQITTRQKLQIAKNRPRYNERQGPAVAVNVTVNHAEVLENARTRAREHRPTPRRVEEAIDATFSEAAPAPRPLREAARPMEKPRASHADEPLDTTWLEGGVSLKQAEADVNGKADVEKAEPEPKKAAWYE